MSGKKIPVDRLASEVMKGLNEYSDLADNVLKKAVKDAGTKVKKLIRNTAPSKHGTYAKSWRTKTTAESSHNIEVTVYSPTRYFLAHLLENGHAKRNGGRVSGKAHIAPAEETAANEMVMKIERELS